MKSMAALEKTLWVEDVEAEDVHLISNWFGMYHCWIASDIFSTTNPVVAYLHYKCKQLNYRQTKVFICYF